MTNPDTAPAAPGRRKPWAARLRKLLWLLRTVDVDEIAGLIGQFDARLQQVEQSQRQIQAMLAEAHDRIEAILQPPDTRINLASNLNIKNLGYELGRSLAEASLAGRPVRQDHRRLHSKLCTQDDFATDWLRYWCDELRTAPLFHRKIWELCYVAQALFAAGQLAAGRRGIGFGCGEEPLPSLFAKYGARVLATDLDPADPQAEIWRLTSQHAHAVETLRRPDICPDHELLGNIDFQTLDMNAIPRALDGQFDFCWSTCALEHLGTIENGLRFIENALATLKKGGIAVHTTEFTINDGATIDNHPIVLYQRRHLESLADGLHAAGHEVAEFDFNPGNGIMDRFVDLPPFSGNELIAPQHSAHLKLLFDGYTCTSVGIIITA
ncbi:MAG TPA: class I SAM-dependent methyltransferase [Stellaceae bacterium]|nr:class I SAM-dependent methyltransferase [Stellaceae bacterium]